MKWLIANIIFLMICGPELFAEVAVDTVSQERYEVLAKQIDYSKYKRVLRLKDNILQDLEEETKEEEVNTKSIGVLNFFGGLFNAVAYVLIAILLIGIMYFLLSNVKLQRKIEVETEEGLTKLKEENIEDIEISDQLKHAIESKDYRLALRYQYLGILQFANRRNLIEWKREKTNRDYQRELRGTDHFHLFHSLSRSFEFVWYGDREIDQSSYEKLVPEFDSFYKIAL